MENEIHFEDQWLLLCILFARFKILVFSQRHGGLFIVHALSMLNHGANMGDAGLNLACLLYLSNKNVP